MKKKVFHLFLLLFSTASLAQNVNIPDANFKAELVSNTAINTNLDTEIQISEATAFAGEIDVSNKSIADLTGIEAFTAITGLSCDVNSLTSINVSSNTALTYLVCANNQLTSLDVSNCPALDYLNCLYNQLTSLDVSANTELIELQCGGNKLTNLNVTGCTKLTTLVCNYNLLTTLNLSTNTAITDFFCNDNLFTSMNVASNTSMSKFFCNNNSISSLDLVVNTALTMFDCNNNSLTSLNIKNGNNTNLAYIDVTLNSSLTCIQVDDANYMNTNWSSAKDATASYNTDCSTGVNEGNNNNSVSFFPNPTKDIVNISWDSKENFNTISIVDVTGRLLKKEKTVNTNFHLIDMSEIPSGIYVIEMKNEHSILCKKLVKN